VFQKSDIINRKSTETRKIFLLKCRAILDQHTQARHRKAIQARRRKAILARRRKAILG
jgi:hypothetical protein